MRTLLKKVQQFFPGEMNRKFGILPLYHDYNNVYWNTKEKLDEKEVTSGTMMWADAPAPVDPTFVHVASFFTAEEAGNNFKRKDGYTAWLQGRDRNGDIAQINTLQINKDVHRDAIFVDGDDPEETKIEHVRQLARSIFVTPDHNPRYVQGHNYMLLMLLNLDPGLREFTDIQRIRIRKCLLGLEYYLNDPYDSKQARVYDYMFSRPISDIKKRLGDKSTPFFVTYAFMLMYAKNDLYTDIVKPLVAVQHNVDRILRDEQTINKLIKLNTENKQNFDILLELLHAESISSIFVFRSGTKCGPPQYRGQSTRCCSQRRDPTPSRRRPKRSRKPRSRGLAGRSRKNGRPSRGSYHRTQRRA
jgi:hypothetical protein